MRLYGEVGEIFPQSPLAGEAMYRSADIRWQIEKVDVMSLPSAKEQESYLRRGMNEDYFKKVMKKFPNTKWAYLAAYHLIDNKLCGDWQGQSKCPQKEAEIYENYAKQYP
jgi:outer membrane protein assembly factor BamD (BamD/ComL family)